MAAVFLANTVIGFLLLLPSGLIAGIIFRLLSGLLGNTIFYVTSLLVSFLVLYVSYVLLAVFYCRLVQMMTKNKEGVFSLKFIFSHERMQYHRVTTDGLVVGLARPLFPIMPFLVSFMGAKVGRGFVLMGKIFNPDLVECGDNVLIGDGALLTAHIVSGDRLVLGKIKIGDDVTVGIRSLVMPDVEVGDRSTIASYAVVTRGTRIPPDEIWGGIPARKIGQRSSTAN